MSINPDFYETCKDSKYSRITSCDEHKKPCCPMTCSLAKSRLEQEALEIKSPEIVSNGNTS